jgi:Electron transfer DM13
MASSSTNVTPKRIVLGVVGLLILAAIWFAFRPEKLFINKKVNEALPSQTAGQLKPLLTGRFVGELHKTSGRATVYQQADGTRVLRLTDFSTSNGPAVHVLLIDGPSTDPSKDFALTVVKNVDLGDLKGNQGDQDYTVPKDVDLKTFGTVSIYCEQFHANFGTAKLEEF